MPPFRKISSCSLLAALLATSLFSSKARAQFSAGIFYDQDYSLEMLGIPSLNEDRNYTMGLGIFIRFDGLKKVPVYKPLYLLNRVFGRSFLNDPYNLNPGNSTSVMLGNGSFTPDSLPATYAIYNDRPYGSLTYLEFRTSFTDNTAFKWHSSTFNVGLLGTGISRGIQTSIHIAQNNGDTKNPRTPRGWDHQVSNGGELTFLYTGEFEKLLKYRKNPPSRTSLFGAEFKHGVKYSLGYYTGINYSMSLRIGKIDPRNWTYTTNSLGNSAGVAQSYWSSPAKGEIYFYTSLRPGFILYNALLNGQFRKSDVRLSFADMRHIVVDAEAGMVFSPVFNGRHAVTGRLRFAGRSPEFEFPTRKPRSHYWGGIDLFYTLR